MSGVVSYDAVITKGLLPTRKKAVSALSCMPSSTRYFPSRLEYYFLLFFSPVFFFFRSLESPDCVPRNAQATAALASSTLVES